MSSFGAGFAEGFFGVLGERMQKRSEDAEEYFQKQMEMARTVGMKNKKATSQIVSQNVTLAKQLQQMGVPKDLIMAVANQNPDDLTTLYEQVNTIRSKGGQIDETFFKDFIEVGGNFKAPDEDYATFFNRIYSPLASNIEADPEGFNRDRKGGIFATIMGYNAMDLARERLEKTDVVGGMSAADLVQYGDGIVPNLGAAGEGTVTFNYGKVAELAGKDKLPIPQVQSLNKEIEDTITTIIGTEFTFEDRPSRVELKKLAIERVRKNYAEYPEVQQYLDGLLKQLGEEGEEGVSPLAPPETIEEEALPPLPGTDTPVEPLGGTLQPQVGDQAPEVASEEDRRPIDPTDEPDLYVLTGGYVFVKDKGDGTSIYQDRDGNLVRLNNAEVRAHVRKELGS